MPYLQVAGAQTTFSPPPLPPLGVKFYDGVQVNWVDVADGKVAGVKTNKGDIECEIFVNCAGLVSSNHINYGTVSFVRPPLT